MKYLKSLSILILAGLLIQASTVFAQAGADQDQDGVKKVKDAELGSTKNVHRCDKLFLAGQFQSDDLELFSKESIKRIITLRTEGEIKWDEKSESEKAGFEFVEVPFRSPDSLDDNVFDKIRKLLKDQKTPTLLHCGSANRVGAVWLPYRVLDQKVDLETALKEAKEIGLRTKEYEKRALKYIEQQQAKNKKK